MNIKQKIVTVIYCLLPAVVSLIAVNLEVQPVLSYICGKALMLIIPLLVWRVWQRSFADIRRDAGLLATNLKTGLALGLLFTATILAAYFLFFRDTISPAPVADKVRSLGIMNYYWWAAVYFSLGNAFLEEYYFRSFLVGRFMKFGLRPLRTAAINGAVFGLHHLVVLVTMLPVTYAVLLSVATAAAGFIWSYARARGVSIIDCYLSHVMADLAIFYAAWNLMRL